MYIVIELQTNDGVASTVVNSYDTLNEAYQKYYLILSAAAVSSIDVHAAIILSEHGEIICANSFEH